MNIWSFIKALTKLWLLTRLSYIFVCVYVRTCACLFVCWAVFCLLISSPDPHPYIPHLCALTPPLSWARTDRHLTQVRFANTPRPLIVAKVIQLNGLILQMLSHQKGNVAGLDGFVSVAVSRPRLQCSISLYYVLQRRIEDMIADHGKIW